MRRVLNQTLRGKREVDTLLAGYAALSDATKQNVTVISAFIEKAGSAPGRGVNERYVFGLQGKR